VKTLGNGHEASDYPPGGHRCGHYGRTGTSPAHAATTRGARRARVHGGRASRHERSNASGACNIEGVLALADTPRRGTDAFAVKVAIHENRKTEYFWISDFTRRDRAFSGRIDNIPRLVKRLRQDDVITFAESEIVDWMYRENSSLKGNYTGCALLKQEKKRDAEAFKRRVGLTCDF
jgi:uncharacterized protein YegJ (DUF2314 family)